MDKNHDGRVNASELKAMLESLGILLTDNMIRRVLYQVNMRDDGLINEEEFMTWMARLQISMKDDVMEDLLAAFRVFDKDRNGFITRDELRVAMEMIGEPLSDLQLDELLKVTDVDNDGRINYEEFVRILL
ncbi:calcium-binding protein E63-1-like isoform X2 [Limulus polyphemus]|nr:calcium-binding protein E63-1-like isoform X2 [Limulus polyphemus]XP_022252198.1 calcium-binding protein E63-1-like isoform X2 [Limulus polyphemus]XP_022252199.1 calcium-binding protein E63-1-like isoform X2 [Limulus polyphemus]